MYRITFVNKIQREFGITSGTMKVLRLGHKKTGGPGRVQLAEAAPEPTRSLLMSESQKVKENLSKNDILLVLTLCFQ